MKDDLSHLLIGDSPEQFPGGGGALSIYTGGGVPRHIQKGGLRHGHNPKKEGLRHGDESKKGVLIIGLVEKTILVTDVAQKGALEIIY